MVSPAQLPLLCMVDSNRLHVSTLHAGHLIATQRPYPKESHPHTTRKIRGDVPCSQYTATPIWQTPDHQL